MNKQQFTQHIADNPKQFGIWSMSAKLALQENNVNLYVHHWWEQWEDEGSRPNVERTLGEELTGILVGFYDEEEQ